ncbi:MAG TPA: hypothetical protein VGJ44_08065, partial [Kribbellaceae bacterium]
AGHIRTIELSTAAGQANRSAIERMADANRTLVSAQLNGVKSSTRANAVIDRANGLFDRNAAKIYGAKTKAYEYAVQVGHIPHVAATDVRFNDSAARAKMQRLKDWIDSLNPVLTVSIHTIGAPNAGGAGKFAQAATGGTVTRNGIKRYDFGGTVGGRGGPTADDQLIWASTDEEVIPAAAARRNRPLLKAISAGRYAAGGTVGAPSAGPRRRSGGRVHGRLEISADSAGTLRAWVRDIVLDESDFAATTGRM